MPKPKKLLLIIAGILIALAVLFISVNRAGAPSGNQSIEETSETSQQQSNFDKARYSLTDPSSIWVVVNKQRSLDPLTYAPSDLVSVGGSQQLRKAAANALTQMFADAREAGLELKPLSGYRSYSRQVTVYNNEVKANGQAVADTQSAKPGFSEHQTGLAIDIGGGGCGIENCFGDTDEGQWVAANGYKYGFIVRYIPGKEDITGYRAEPWHIRYIGPELATEMHNTGVTTLEEFFNL